MAGRVLMWKESEWKKRRGGAGGFVVSRIGVADVRAFGLTWEDCENLLDRLGYRTRVEGFA